LTVRPIVNCRDHHALTQENPGFDTAAEVSGAQDVILMKPRPDGPPIRLCFPGSIAELWGDWYHDFEYPAEAERGLDCREDQYSPGFFTSNFRPGDTSYVIAAAEDGDAGDPEDMIKEESRRRARSISTWSMAPADMRTLAGAAGAFIVERSSRAGEAASYGIVAGYHWFEEWGRDAMISLPGLTLVTGRHDVARSVLTTFFEHRRNGLIPNRIPDIDGEPDYNTADATLWAFWAVQKYLEYTGDREFVMRSLLPVLEDIVDWHVRGTEFGIGMDDDGLLRAGDTGTQLTWMDAKVADWVVTPRRGKPVEVNALWYNALRFVESLGGEHTGPPALAVAREFLGRFWDDEIGHLNDVVDSDGGCDASLRPNQILAVSLPYPALEGEPARRVVEAVRRKLLTPYGLRTLAPDDSAYRGRYAGDQWARDGAYHQGTVWPWLLGPFITAYVRVAEDKAGARDEGGKWLLPLLRHLREAGLGHVSEIFDGDFPHAARGCIAQAWSAAEILRAAVEDLEIPLTAQ
jgi:predicted glycogen debranching enzyme